MAASDVALQVATVASGAGIVQLGIFLLRRRSEITALDRTSSKPLLEEQGAFIDRLAAAEAKAQKRADEVDREFRQARVQYEVELERVAAQASRLARQVASLRVDLDLANLQLEEFRRKLGLPLPETNEKGE